MIVGNRRAAVRGRLPAAHARAPPLLHEDRRPASRSRRVAVLRRPCWTAAQPPSASGARPLRGGRIESSSLSTPARRVLVGQPRAQLNRGTRSRLVELQSMSQKKKKNSLVTMRFADPPRLPRMSIAFLPARPARRASTPNAGRRQERASSAGTAVHSAKPLPDLRANSQVAVLLGRDWCASAVDLLTALLVRGSSGKVADPRPGSSRHSFVLDHGGLDGGSDRTSVPILNSSRSPPP